MRDLSKPVWKLAVSKWQLYLLLLPAVLYIAVFAYGPMYGLQIAFKDYNVGLGIWDSEWVGLKHFSRFIAYPKFWDIVGNTFIISIYGIATFPCPIIFALLLNEIRNRHFRKTIQMVSYVPHFFSTVVICSLVLLFADRATGPINNLVALLGGVRKDFISDTRLFSSIYVWSGVWQDLGWSSIIYLAVLAGVSPELIEAAVIDGADRLQIIRHVNLPMIMPTVVTMLILSSGSILSVGFEKIYLMQNALNLDVSEVISTYVYEIGLKGAQFSYSSAIGLFNTTVSIIFLAVVNSLCKRLADVSIW